MNLPGSELLTPFHLGTVDHWQAIEVATLENGLAFQCRKVVANLNFSLAGIFEEAGLLKPGSEARLTQAGGTVPASAKRGFGRWAIAAIYMML